MATDGVEQPCGPQLYGPVVFSEAAHGVWRGVAALAAWRSERLTRVDGQDGRVAE
jgi:hypothetical protein